VIKVFYDNIVEKTAIIKKIRIPQVTRLLASGPRNGLDLVTIVLAPSLELVKS
jgi:hypothetical protein